MPTPITLTTFFAEDSGFGWSEKHVKLAPEAEPNLGVYLSLFVGNVVTKRRVLLGEGTAIVGYRASYPRAGAIASNAGAMPMKADDGRKCATFANSLAVNFDDETFTRSKIVHLRGHWDAVDVDSEYTPGAPGAEGWSSAFTQWWQALVQGGYGWMTRSAANSKKGNVTNYVIGDDGKITFTLEAPGIATVPNGSVINVRFSKLNNRNSVLNRQLLVTKVSDTSLRTTTPIAAFEFSGEGQYDYRVTEFVAYAGVGVVKPGKRAMGRPTNRVQSRSQARARG